MQSNHKNSIENNKNINKNNIDELLLKNQELLNRLILENLNKREKSYISTGEYEILKIYENNLIQLMENCPTNKLNEILAEINELKAKKDNIEKQKPEKNKFECINTITFQKTNSMCNILKLNENEFVTSSREDKCIKFWNVIVLVHSNLLFFNSHFFIVLSQDTDTNSFSFISITLKT